MTNWKAVVIVILVAIIALIISGVVWGIVASEGRKNCVRFVDEIKNNPDGYIAKDCKRYGFTLNQ